MTTLHLVCRCGAARVITDEPGVIAVERWEFQEKHSGREGCGVTDEDRGDGIDYMTAIRGTSRPATILRPNLSTPENREFWASVRRVADEVRRWPAWMRGECDRTKEGTP